MGNNCVISIEDAPDIVEAVKLAPVLTNINMILCPPMWKAGRREVIFTSF